LSIKIITRGAGKSAVAAAAYRAGETIKNEYDGIVHDYSRKKGIAHTEIMLPEHAPAEYSNRAALWNAVEKSERFCNAQLAREIEIALPVELDREQNISLVRRFVNEQFVAAGMCADICVHDTDGKNPHAHVMLTMRPIEKDGRWGQKSHTVNGRKINTVDWNDRNKAEDWRRAWAAYCNTALRIHGSDSVVDHRSYKRQGVEQVPTVHMGVAATRMERRGIRTERGDQNRQIEITNREIRQLRARINKLSDWLKNEEANTAPPTLADVLNEILTRQGQSALSRVKSGAEILYFLHSNKIYSMEDLENKVNAMHGKLNSTSAELKKGERRIDTLHEHLRHSGNFKSYRKTKRRYEELYSVFTAARKGKGFLAERKAQKALSAANEYHEARRSELAMFDSAEQYLRDILQERFDPKKLPPITVWEKELAEKLATKDALYRDYYALKDEIYKVEKIRAGVKAILHNETPERTVQKSQGVEL